MFCRPRNDYLGGSLYLHGDLLILVRAIVYLYYHFRAAYVNRSHVIEWLGWLADCRNVYKYSKGINHRWSIVQVHPLHRHEFMSICYESARVLWCVRQTEMDQFSWSLSWHCQLVADKLCEWCGWRMIIVSIFKVISVIREIILRLWRRWSFYFGQRGLFYGQPWWFESSEVTCQSLALLLILCMFSHPWSFY